MELSPAGGCLRYVASFVIIVHFPEHEVSPVALDKIRGITFLEELLVHTHLP